MVLNLRDLTRPQLEPVLGWVAAGFLLKPQNSCTCPRSPHCFLHWLQERILAFWISPLAQGIVSRKTLVNCTEEWKWGWPAGARRGMKCGVQQGGQSEPGCVLGAVLSPPSFRQSAHPYPPDSVRPHLCLLSTTPVLAAPRICPSFFRFHELPSLQCLPLSLAFPKPAPCQFHHCVDGPHIPGSRVSLLHWSVRHRGRQKTSARTEIGGNVGPSSGFPPWSQTILRRIYPAFNVLPEVPLPIAGSSGLELLAIPHFWAVPSHPARLSNAPSSL